MIQELVTRIATKSPIVGVLRDDQVAQRVLNADPLDIWGAVEDCWAAANMYDNAFTYADGLLVSTFRDNLRSFGVFHEFAPPTNRGQNTDGYQAPGWPHLAYAFALENTRMPQIMRRVVHAFRSGEGLGIPSTSTQRWLDVTETLLFGMDPLVGLLGTSTVRPDPEAVRRNAYWRMFGMDLPFGTEKNTPYAYDKAQASNTTFLALFEELLFELWRAIENITNKSGVNATDDDRIYRLAQQLGYVLRSRRQNSLLSREELGATTALGWLELTLSANSSVVVDMRADATSPADRLRLIGERVGLAPHSKAASFFAMAKELSLMLRYIESGVISKTTSASLLYVADPAQGPAIGEQVRRVITEWGAATGRDFKLHARPVEVRPRALSGAR